MGPTAAVQICELNPACDQRFRDLERRMKNLEDDDFKREIWEAIRAIEKGFANLNGRVTGYLLAGGLLGAVVATLASVLVQLMLKA